MLGVSREPIRGVFLEPPSSDGFFFFGADILSTAISSMALMVTFLSFGAFAFVYLVKGKEGGARRKGKGTKHPLGGWTRFSLPCRGRRF